MGRKRTPIERQIAEGDPRQRGPSALRQALESQPKAQAGLPECPADLGPLARKAWDFWATELEKMGLAFRPDSIALEAACVHYERAKLADGMVTKHGLVVVEHLTDRHGQLTGQKKIRRNPAIAISLASWAMVRSFCSEFGMTPVGRMHLQVDRSEGERQDLMELLTRPRQKKNTPVN